METGLRVTGSGSKISHFLAKLRVMVNAVTRLTRPGQIRVRRPLKWL